MTTDATDETFDPGEGVHKQLFDLSCAVREHFPNIAASRVHTPPDAPDRADGPEDFLRVTSGQQGPWRIVWNDDLGMFHWDTGPHAGTILGPHEDLPRSAQAIADGLRT